MPDGVHPRVVAATREQLRAREEALRRGARHVGWKVALDFAEIEAVIGPQPVIGHLTSETVLEPAARFSLAGSRAPRAETELVVRIGPDGAVAAVAVGLELVDVARPPDDLEGIIAGNVAHRACVLGAGRATRPRAGATGRTWVNGALRGSGRLPADWPERLAAAGDALAAVGLGLERGDAVLVGALTHVPVRPGDHVVAEIEGLGEAELRLVD